MDTIPLVEIRCPCCNKLWFKARGKKLKIEIKCHKCQELFIFYGVDKTPIIERTPRES